MDKSVPELVFWKRMAWLSLIIAAIMVVLYGACALVPSPARADVDPLARFSLGIAPNIANSHQVGGSLNYRILGSNLTPEIGVAAWRACHEFASPAIGKPLDVPLQFVPHPTHEEAGACTPAFRADVGASYRIGSNVDVGFYTDYQPQSGKSYPNLQSRLTADFTRFYFQISARL